MQIPYIFQIIQYILLLPIPKYQLCILWIRYIVYLYTLSDIMYIPYTM